MSYEITATDFNDLRTTVNIDKKDADYCPICHRNVDPIHIASFLTGQETSSRYLQRVYRCPNSQCVMTFLALYRCVPQSGMTGHCWYFYERVEPGYPLAPSIPPKIEKISKDFAKIYKQASYAENYGLKDICGSGYRKSLEFLVKDFLISRCDKLGIDKDKITKTSLYNCIINWIEDPMTKSVAKRATWLGNDETHYYRKWEDKDLRDLTNLLRLTINAIENQLLAESYEEDMKEP